ncbi:hypothetical protein [Acinetobacter wuhouensis]|uniref:Lipoprotein n=1 Tax=Acinetobacter wuhouensis TaxID=1879050 RepID=A0A3G2T722_9GAMM|nr:hypothetical protein [Acinetobacter wuhouensis]AYO55296.1 hypothetical protein CDG68_17305 [Acinetobacter wuhouensis]
MKPSFLLSVIILLTGCSLGTSREIKTAEKLLNQFQCNNIETNELAHSAINIYHEHALSTSKQKAVQYVESYKLGQALFKIPLDEVVQQQYEIYTTACESLGGVQSPTVKTNEP